MKKENKKTTNQKKQKYKDNDRESTKNKQGDSSSIKKDKVKKEELLYKCQWSPLEGITLTGKVMKTFVNGTCVYSDGKICNSNVGKRLQFNR